VKPSSPNSKLATLLRFVFCGLIGLWLMLLTSVSFYLSLMGENGFLHPLVILPFVVLSSLLLLYGIGEWGRWAYLWIFHAPLPSVLLLGLLPGGDSKEAAFLVIIASPIVAYFAVKAYYHKPADAECENRRNTRPVLPYSSRQ